MKAFKLRRHQASFLDRNPDVCLLFWAPRTGKTLTAVEWSKLKKRDKNLLVICPKKVKSMWIEELPNARVLTKEDIKKYGIPYGLSAIIIDEVHNNAGDIWGKKTSSAIAERTYNIIRANPEAHLLMLSGTPVTNNPMSLMTLLALMGDSTTLALFKSKMYHRVKAPFFVLRRYNQFRVKSGKKPMHTLMIEEPVSRWRKIARKVLENRNGSTIDIIRLEDCVDSLPKEEKILENVKGGTHDKDTCENCHWTHIHLAEQEHKMAWIKEHNFDKLIIVAHYREQVDAIALALEKDRPGHVYKVHGGTTGEYETRKQWHNDEYGYMVVSATMGESWDGYTANAMVFLSMSHKVLDHIQMKERLTTLQPELMKPKLYYHLIGGKIDKAIYESVVIAGKDFRYE